VNFVQSHVTKSLYIWERANGKAIERERSAAPACAKTAEPMIDLLNGRHGVQK